MASEEQRRERTRARTQKWRSKKGGDNGCDAAVTHGDACDAREYPSPSSSVLPSSKNGGVGERALSKTEFISRERELERVDKEIGSIRARYSVGERWEESDKTRVKTLKSRKAELLQLLGAVA